jgi:hypothetical protein
VNELLPPSHIVPGSRNDDIEDHVSRLDSAYAEIDAANAEDPTLIDVDGRSRPAELVYGERMTRALGELYPDASEALKLAVRAQHIRRWTVPRASYPMDRPGYLRWRTDLKRKHAEWAGAILASCGYSTDEIARVGSLIRKENLKQDPEAQALEDVASIVFLKHYAADFAPKHDAGKLVGILAKTLAKMSSHGRSAAMDLPLPAAVRDLIAKAVAGAAAPGHKP